MQVNRINENTIRVKISKEELAERGIKVLDMINDRNKIQNFFYSILSEIDTDHAFSKGTPVSFQVMPNNGGLDLLISKVQAQDANTLNKLLGGTTDISDDHSEQDLRKTSFADLNDSEPASSNKVPNSNDNIAAQNRQSYCFKDLGMAIELADNLRVADLASSLYYFKNKYYLELAFLNEDYTELKPDDTWAVANEFGLKTSVNEMKTVKELGKCIIRQDALGNIRRYFIHAKQN